VVVGGGEETDGRFAVRVAAGSTGDVPVETADVVDGLGEAHVC
jgi:hypothetical protein